MTAGDLPATRGNVIFRSSQQVDWASDVVCGPRAAFERLGRWRSDEGCGDVGDGCSALPVRIRDLACCIDADRFRPIRVVPIDPIAKRRSAGGPASGTSPQ